MEIVVVVVGRPNVGRSQRNALAGEMISVKDAPGVTETSLCGCDETINLQ